MTRSARASGFVTISGLVLLVAGGAMVGFYYLRGTPAAAGPNGPTAAPPVDESGGVDLRAPVEQAVTAFLAQPATLTFQGQSIRTTYKDAGLVADPPGIRRAAARAAAEHVDAAAIPGWLAKRESVPVALDRVKALETLVAYKDQYDRPAVDARVDMDDHKVMPSAEGFGMQVYESMAALEDAARAGRAEVALVGATVKPNVPSEKLKDLDVSNVMGWFETHFPPGERDRNFNLRLAASRANGHIIMPGETFSFNDVVGERTEKQGYHVAHVISAGEMIDGLAGGACQVSTTLHGAAWFAGLDLVDSRPHSRPSAYVTMGLDATVVYPTTDLKLRNPYEWPVVIHYTVSQGTMRVEILGQKRPWDKIAFERSILKETPYETVSRDDDSMPVGSSLITQAGFPGYQLIRRRVFYKDGKPVKTEKWDVSYPPTTEYVVVGTNPDPNLTAPTQPEIHPLPAPGGKSTHIEE